MGIIPASANPIMQMKKMRLGTKSYLKSLGLVLTQGMVLSQSSFLLST